MLPKVPKQAKLISIKKWKMYWSNEPYLNMQALVLSCKKHPGCIDEEVIGLGPLDNTDFSNIEFNKMPNAKTYEGFWYRWTDFELDLFE